MKTRAIMKSGIFMAEMLCASFAVSAASVDSFFSSDMVVQRDVAFPIYGTGSAKEAVEVSIDGRSVGKATADAAGKWRIELPAMPASKTPFEMKVKFGGGDVITLDNVVAGDIWVCAGQSNMEYDFTPGSGTPPWPVVLGWDEIKADAEKRDLIRHLKIDRVGPGAPLATTQAADSWTAASDDISGFTATGYLFARRLNDELDIPIGLVNATWSGQKIQPFIDGGIFNGMITPIARFPIKGVIYYQGEADSNMQADTADAPEVYAAKMRKLVAAWRGAWRNKDLPFYYVQLASYGAANRSAEGSDLYGWSKIREGQRLAMDIPGVGMATAIDLVSFDDRFAIHPPDKKDVGERLALWALAKTYGRTGFEYCGPVPVSAEVEDGGIRVKFSHVGKGLMAAHKDWKAMLNPPVKDEPERLAMNFYLVRGDGKSKRAKSVKIEGDSVLVTGPAFKKAVKIRYADSEAPSVVEADGSQVPMLYNVDGLPATPFVLELPGRD